MAHIHYQLAALCLLFNVAVDGLPLEEAESRRQPLSNQPLVQLPEPDGMLHVYALPVGQGDSHVFQCPSGALSIIDLGTSDSSTAGFWFTPELRAFFQGQYHQIRNVILTHNHFDHYSFIPDVLDPDTSDLSGLNNVYVSCTYNDLVTSIKNWVDKISASKLRLFNNGQPCGPNGVACETIDLCPDDPDVTAKVMSANVGQQCVAGNKNIDSLVFKVMYGSTSVLFNGDFEDFTSSWTENGPQKSLVDYYGEEMKVTVYKLSHHGAQNLANKPISRDAHAPKATFVSGNPWYSYFHPRCDVTDAFINYVRTICQPAIGDVAHPDFCGLHPYYYLPVEDLVQQVYTCGYSNGTLRTTVDNSHAIYSTVPDAQTINVVELVIDGQRDRWGFLNHYMSRMTRQSERVDQEDVNDHQPPSNHFH